MDRVLRNSKKSNILACGNTHESVSMKALFEFDNLFSLTSYFTTEEIWKSARNFLHSNAGAVMWSVRFAVSTIANSVLTVVIVVTGANTISRSYQVRFLRTLKCHYASGSSLCISLTIFFNSDSLSRIVFFFLISNLKFLY